MGSKDCGRMQSCVGRVFPTRTQAQEGSGRVSRTAAACSESIGGGGAQGCTRRDVDCAATSAQKWLQKRAGAWLRRAVRGRVAGRAVRQADRTRRQSETQRGRADADRSAAGSARWMRPCCGCEGECRGWRSDGAGKSRCKSGFSLAPRPT
jgi:hypothetical protein